MLGGFPEVSGSLCSVRGFTAVLRSSLNCEGNPQGVGASLQCWGAPCSVGGSLQHGALVGTGLAAPSPGTPLLSLQ